MPAWCVRRSFVVCEEGSDEVSDEVSDEGDLAVGVRARAPGRPATPRAAHPLLRMYGADIAVAPYLECMAQISRWTPT